MEKLMDWGFKKLTFMFCKMLSIGLILLFASGQTWAALNFSKSLDIATIGPGSVSTLTYTINNTDSSLVNSLAFTHTLPTDVTFASPANALTTCLNAEVTITGGNMISLSGGDLGASSVCTISADVTSSTPGAHTLPVAALSSSAGNVNSLAVDLTVATDRAGFSKSFSPGSIAFGGRSTLTYTIDNSLNGNPFSFFSFVESFPKGIQTASPLNSATTCGGNVTFTPAGDGTSVSVSGQTFSSIPIAANSICTISFDVVGNLVGTINSTSSNLLHSYFGTSDAGKASDSLVVTIDALSLIKSFTDDPVAVGEDVTLNYTISNLDRSDNGSAITFSDNLDSALSGLVADPASFPINPCGVGSSLSGTSILTLTDGNIAAQEFCTFSVTLNVPSGASTGSYSSESGTLSGLLNGSPVVGNKAEDTLFVQPSPILSKSFNPATAAGGASVAIEYTITNASATDAASSISFTDSLISGLTPGTMPSSPCGGSSSINLTYDISGTPESLVFSSGILAAGATCNFSVPFTVSLGMSTGTYSNTSSEINATILGDTFSGKVASASLVVAAAPIIHKSFTNDPVAAGGTVSLQYTVTHDDFAASNATAVSFSDDYNSVISGLTVASISADDCGVGTSITGTGTSSLTFTGGTIGIGSSCTFTVTLNVPAGVSPGSYSSDTSNISATVSGLSVSGNPASDDLDIGGLNIVKSFTDDPVIPGGSVTLEYSITNTSSDAATSISFTDNLSDALSGLVSSSGTLNNVCGSGSISGTSFISFAGGDLAAGDSCTFSITLAVPGSAINDSYRSVTSSLTASIDSSLVTLAPAIDHLSVSGEQLQISKAFSSTFASPGGTVNLEFVITNLNPTQTATEIAFSDDLDGILSGLVSTSGTVADVCGAGSEINGTTSLAFSDGTLAGGTSCTFSVSLSIPSAIGSVNSITNTTSSLTGKINSLTVAGSATSAELKFRKIQLTKSFSKSVELGGIANLTYTLSNLNTTDAISAITFSDDLSSIISGLTTYNLPLTDVCGSGSSISGSNYLSISGGFLAAGASCSFTIPVVVPLTATPGTYPGAVSTIFSNGIFIGEGAGASLIILESQEAPQTSVTTQLVDGDGNTSVSVIPNSSTVSGVSLLPWSDDPVAGITFPFGVVAYKVKSAIGGSETVRINFSSSLPSGGFFVYKIDNQGMHTLIPSSMWQKVGDSGIQLTLTDGGPFDLDGVTNGEIVDPVAIGVPLDDELQTFTLTPWENVAFSQWIASDPVIIKGISQAIDVSIEGGLFSIDGGAYQRNNTTIGLGQSLKILVESAATALTTNTASLSVGSHTTAYAVTTGSDANNLLLSHGNSCSAESVDWVQKFYIAYYGRPADTGGVNYWSCALDEAGGLLNAIVEAFGSSREFTNRYGQFNNEQLIDNIYQQLFNRNAESEGKSYWLEKLNTEEITLSNIAIAILNGALGDDLLTINNKLDVAKEFTSRTGIADVTTIDFYSILTNVTDDSETVTAAKDSIPDLVDQAVANEASF